MTLIDLLSINQKYRLSGIVDILHFLGKTKHIVIVLKARVGDEKFRYVRWQGQWPMRGKILISQGSRATGTGSSVPEIMQSRLTD